VHKFVTSKVFRHGLSFILQISITLSIHSAEFSIPTIPLCNLAGRIYLSSPPFLSSLYRTNSFPLTLLFTAYIHG